jgi:hypothetical protein
MSCPFLAFSAGGSHSAAPIRRLLNNNRNVAHRDAIGGSPSPQERRTCEDGCNCPAKRTKSIPRDLRNGATATRDRGVRAAPHR